MKNYTGTKQVKAQPMNLGEFVKAYRNPYGEKITEHEENEPGYLVKYEDCYESWSPKEVFEKAYKLSETYLDRIGVEWEQLSDRYEKCNAFINSDKFHTLTKNEYARILQVLQARAMGSYLNCLRNRIELENGCKTECNTEFEFGEAIQALKYGLPIRRKGWNGKGLYVVKQIPAHIDSNIIPKMQSLPQSAKDLILKGKGYIDYTSQCLIINENTGRADSWTPSIADVFAEDWEIVL